MFDEITDRLFGFRRPKFPLKSQHLAIKDAAASSSLVFPLFSGTGVPYEALVKEGDQVKPGQFLGSDGVKKAVVCPVKGKVVGVISGPDARNHYVGHSVAVDPDPDSSPVAWKPMDPETASARELWARVAEAGILTESYTPRPLGEIIGPEADVEVETLVVLASDREPEVFSTSEVFRWRSEDVFIAAKVLGKMAGAKDVYVAAHDKSAGQTGKSAGGTGVKVLSVPPEYPMTLKPMVALRAGGGKGVRVITAGTALAALDAIRDGKVQDKKVVTFIGPKGEAKANLRAPIGAKLKDLFAFMGLKPRDGDKVLAGGPLRGIAQYSLEAPVDAGLDAVMLIPRENILPWSDEPCVSCGACVSVCPVNLQPSLLGRYSEFSIFEPADDLGVMNCVECGLCAMVCTARRPLVQMIRLAKREVTRIRNEAEQKAKDKKAREEAEEACKEQNEPAVSEASAG